jgi:hypothetical protein
VKTFREWLRGPINPSESVGRTDEAEPIEDYTHIGHKIKPGCPIVLWYWAGSGGLFVYEVPEGKQDFHGDGHPKYGDPDYWFRHAYRAYLWSGRFDKCKKAISASPRNQHTGVRFPAPLARDLYKQFGGDNQIYQADWNGGGMKPLGLEY